MAVKEIKDMGASVLARLKKQAQETGLGYLVCVQLFCQEEFLRKLEASKYADNLVLKGGMFIYTLTEFESRPTRDIDFMMRHLSNELGNIEQVMKEICSADTGNGFISMEVIGVEQITPDRDYPGIKTKFVAHIKNMRVNFSIDIGIDDVIVPKAVKRLVCTRLPDFKAPEVYTYSLESTIAEKLDSIIKLMDATSRMKDFYDIYYLSMKFDFEGRVLQEAIARTLEHRRTAYEADTFELIEKFKQNEFMLQLWGNFRGNVHATSLEYATVIDQIVVFLAPIYQGIIHETELFSRWDSKSQQWL